MNEMKEILREVLADDKTILSRRDDLLAALEKKVPNNLRRDYAPIKRAINLNVGEIFFVGESDKDATKTKVADILKSSGMQEARINFVIETFTKALDWDKIHEVEESFDDEEEISEKISQLENELSLLRKERIRQKQFLKKNTATKTITSSEKNIPTVANMTPPPNPVEEKWLNFVTECNLFFTYNGYISQRALGNFFKKYNVQAFSCKNFEARMNEPVPPPQFGAVASPQNADFWAYEFEPGTFAVVPNVKNYTDNHHIERAMGDVFESNFKSGLSYDKIQVEKPAIFNGMWNLKERGKLKLSSERLKISEKNHTLSIQDFVKDFSTLPPPDYYGERRVSEENFWKKYNVHAFSCINFGARFRETIPPPTPHFVSENFLFQVADYWAYEFEFDVFAVVPNIPNSIYTEVSHIARAMGEVFQSNFKRGGTYNKIRVEKPAIFKGMWNLEKPGILELS